MDDRLKQLLVLGREHYERREYDLAEEVLREVVSHTEGYADVHNMLGVIAHERTDFAGAEAAFEKAVELNPTYTEALLNLSVTYNDLGKYELARQTYAKIRRGDGGGPKSLDPYALGKIANMHADLAQAYADVACIDEAIAELRKAVELRPGYADLQVRLGSLYRDAAKPELALSHFRSACDLNPNYVQARLLLGVVLLTLDRPEEAAVQWRAARDLDPENKSAKMYLRMVESAD